MSKGHHRSRHVTHDMLEIKDFLDALEQICTPTDRMQTKFCGHSTLVETSERAGYGRPSSCHSRSVKVKVLIFV